MQNRTASVRVSETAGTSGKPITVLRFSGDITSASKEAVLGTYQGLPPEVKRIVLDLSKVEYINSSGIALIIQVLMQARHAGRSIHIFGLSDHFKKVFTMVGMTKYTELHADEASEIGRASC